VWIRICGQPTRRTETTETGATVRFRLLGLRDVSSPKIVMPIVYWTWMGLHDEAPNEEVTIVDGWRRLARSSLPPSPNTSFAPRLHTRTAPTFASQYPCRTD
jgi:hypothetical protein